MTPIVYVYYSLESFYQNHRYFVKDRSYKQLYGQPEEVDECDTINYDENNRSIAPCGSFANSLFNDTIELEYRKDMRVRKFLMGDNDKSNATIRNDNSTVFESSKQEDGWIQVPISSQGIAWSVDDQVFKNPEAKTIEELRDAFKNTSRPPNWPVDVADLDPLDVENSGFENARLRVWMRTAALPSFRKIYGLISNTMNWTRRSSLPQGSYRLKINYSKFVQSTILH